MTWRSRSDRDWEQIATENAYYGVLTDPLFRGEPDGAVQDQFFASGEEHVASVLATIRRTVSPDFEPHSALDFGCGVGRLVIPLVRRCERVVGCDVSPSMLQETQRNLERRELSAELVVSDDALTAVSGTFDLVHSVLVLQHIPTSRGLAALDELIRRIAPSGVGVVQLPYGYAEARSQRRRALEWLRPRVPLLHAVLNVVRGRPMREPMMQMNCYDLNRVLHKVQGAGCGQAHLEFTDHGGHLGVTIYFRRSAQVA